jgi:hypothetical protein
LPKEDNMEVKIQLEGHVILKKDLEKKEELKKEEKEDGSNN